LRCHDVADLNASASALFTCGPYLWLALPLLVLATLFFYPLLLIAEQALRDTRATWASRPSGR
jgi:hypothetical protein